MKRYHTLTTFDAVLNAIGFLALVGSTLLLIVLALAL